MKPGTLFLIPTVLGDSALGTVIPSDVQQRARTLDYFVAENPKTARAYLKLVGMAKPLQQLHITSLNEHTRDDAISDLAAPLRGGNHMGLMSEAGCPGVADPGAKLVRYAHQHAIRVVPLVGPSSILLALMASGLNGQCFVFHGYLPVAPPEREKTLRELEKQSRRLKQTQVFIEAPYRNMKLMQSIIDVCSAETLLCVATDITLESEVIRTQSVASWRATPSLSFDRHPSVFLILATAARNTL